MKFQVELVVKRVKEISVRFKLYSSLSPRRMQYKYSNINILTLKVYATTIAKNKTDNFNSMFLF